MAGSKPTTSLLALALAAVLAPGTDVSAQNFALTIDRAIVYTPFQPNGFADIQQPYTMCRNYPITLRLKYVWRNSFVEQIYTADGSLSAHVEHTIAVTDDGPLVLTRSA